MNRSARETATDYAEEKIKSYLDAKEYAPALLLSANYVHMRLKSLLADRLWRRGDDWRAIHNNLDINFMSAVRLCNFFGLLKGQNPRELRRLWEKRGYGAHESGLWRNPSKAEKREIERLCESAITFLRKTQGSSRHDPMVNPLSHDPKS